MVWEEAERDSITVSSHGFVETVVDNFPDHVVESTRTCRSDIHPRTFADSLESFEDSNLICSIFAAFIRVFFC